jgi:hypothetical protein
MPQSDLVCDRETLQAILEDVRSHLLDDPLGVLRQVEGKGTSRRSANDFLSYHIPFFAEIDQLEPATETPGGSNTSEDFNSE